MRAELFAPFLCTPTQGSVAARCHKKLMVAGSVMHHMVAMAWHGGTHMEVHTDRMMLPKCRPHQCRSVILRGFRQHGRNQTSLSEEISLSEVL